MGIEAKHPGRCRTSTTKGILKAEAAFRFAAVLKEWKVEFFQDVERVILDRAFEECIRKVPGQTSGKSLRYFFMLAGSDDLVKPDRMILRFLQRPLGRPVSPDEAQAILWEVSRRLRTEYPTITPRLLDHTIWNYERDSAG